MEAPAGQGYEEGSSWSRGQSWAIYGFAISYAHTKEQKYLDAAKQTAHYFIANVSLTDYLPCVISEHPRSRCIMIPQPVPAQPAAFWRSRNMCRKMRKTCMRKVPADPACHGRTVL
ncbi:MAG: hypothetical protein ACLRMZ_03145 [Blautia marasmi]